MRYLAIALGIGILAFGNNGASGEVLSDVRSLDASSTMGKYLLSADFRKQMQDAAVESDKQLKIVCAGAYDAKIVSLGLLKAIDLPTGATHAVSGIWTYRFEATRCGVKKRHTILMAALPDGPPRPTRLLPGDTIAGPQLMVDAHKLAAVSASPALGSDCKEFIAVDTTLTQPPHDVTEGSTVHKGVWNESWTFHGCGKTVILQVRFIPDGKGGTTFAFGR